MTVLLRTTKKELAPHIKSVAGVAPRNSTLGILAYVLIKRRDSAVDFTANDGSLQITSTLELAGDDFAICLPAAKLAQIINALPNEASIVLEKKENAVLLKAGRSKFNIPVLDPDNYPLLTADKAEQVQIEQSTFATAIERVKHAAASNDIRYYLNGLLIEQNGSSITTVGTDGHRLAVASADAECGSGNFILPNGAVAELAKLLDGGSVFMAVGDRTVSFDLGRIHLISKLIDGKYPDIQRVIPANNKNVATVDKQDLLSALAQVQVFANDKLNGVTLGFSEKSLSLACANHDGGESSAVIDIGYKGDDITLGVNVKYLHEAIQAFEGDEVTMRLAVGMPILIDDGATKDLRCVVMPMRL